MNLQLSNWLMSRLQIIKLNLKKLIGVYVIKHVITGEAHLWLIC